MPLLVRATDSTGFKGLLCGEHDRPPNDGLGPTWTNGSGFQRVRRQRIPDVMHHSAQQRLKTLKAAWRRQVNCTHTHAHTSSSQHTRENAHPAEESVIKVMAGAGPGRTGAERKHQTAPENTLNVSATPDN